MRFRNPSRMVSITFLALCTSVLAQAQDDPKPAEVKAPHALLAEADRLAWLFNWPAAGPLYEEAERLFIHAGDARNALHARIGKVRSEAETKSFVDLSDYLATALENPVVAKDPKLKLWILAGKGYIDLEIDVASAQRDWEEVLALAQSLGEKSWEARASGELGIIAFLNGDGTKAQSLLAKAVFSAMANGDAAAQIRFLSIIGQGLSTLNRRDEGLEFFNRALKLAEATEDAAFPFMAHEGKAEALAALGRRPEAIALLNQALEEARSQGKKGHEIQLLIIIGGVYAGAEDYAKALEHLETAGQLAQERRYYRILAQAMLELARIYLDQGELTKAEQRLAVGLDASRRVGDKYFLPRDLSALAELKLKRGQVEEADALYEEATDVVEGLLVNAPGAYAKSFMVGAMSEIYLGHFRLATQKKDAHLGFRVLERVRGRTATDFLRSRPVDPSNPPPPQSAIEKEIVQLQIRLMRAETPQDRRKLLDQLYTAEAKLAPIIGERSSLKRRALEERASLDKLQASLRSDELILEYVLDEPNSFCLAIGQQSAIIITLPAGRKRIEDLVRGFLTEVKSKKPETQEARELYSLLLEPVSNHRGKARLVIVPDGEMHLLPFDSLQDARGQFVLYSHTVTYAPSGSALYFLREARSSTRPSLAFLGVGDVAYDQLAASPSEAGKQNSGSTERGNSRGLYDLQGAKFPRLPGTKQEVVSSGQLFGNTSKVLLDGRATEATFKSQPLSEFAVLHLAAHGVSDMRFPDRAALVLGPDPAATEDGLLQAREISTLTLNAELTTLTACDTGVGRLQGQEGIANLVRAFLLAGSRTVVASLWSADDTF
ncbi:MAG: CHAT domain-containing protein, partial [Acidobacteria bacterium]|nr:CHAT domain-containing protein [Acidobacteriota bacterium]